MKNNAVKFINITCSWNNLSTQPRSMMMLLIGLIFAHFVMQSLMQSCDQRANGGILLCCEGRNNSCIARSVNKTCYCDEHCLSVKDCCQDYKRCSKFQGWMKFIVLCHLHKLKPVLNGCVLLSSTFVLLSCICTCVRMSRARIDVNDIIIWYELKALRIK